MVKTQGRQGEVAADLYTDFPERFAERRRVFALSASGTRRELELESHWGHKGRVVLKFHGVETISDAEQLVGSEIQIPRQQRTKLDVGSAYVSDLVGCSVMAIGAGREQRIGEIAEVQFGAGEAPLLVIRQGKQERLVPFAEEFLSDVDIDHKQVRLKLSEGMLEIDAPLSDEEKREQQRGNFKAPGGEEKGSRGRGRPRHKQ